MRALGLLLLWTPTLLTAGLPVRVPLDGAPGPYTVERWKHDWPGCDFEGGVRAGRLAVTESDGRRWLRVNYAVGKIGPGEGGAGWRWPIGTHEEAELRYTLRFGKDFAFVRGGKLPGLCGGPENVSGGHPADGRNGFSARLMWRAEGRGEAYVYHKGQKGSYGDSFPFPADFRFPTETPLRIRILVTMNQPGRKDGKMRVLIARPDAPEVTVFERADFEWRSAADFGVDGLYFDTFHGGGDSSWAPRQPCWAEFSEISVQSPAAPR